MTSLFFMPLSRLTVDCVFLFTKLVIVFKESPGEKKASPVGAVGDCSLTNPIPSPHLLLLPAPVLLYSNCSSSSSSSSHFITHMRFSEATFADHPSSSTVNKFVYMLSSLCSHCLEVLSLQCCARGFDGALCCLGQSSSLPLHLRLLGILRPGVAALIPFHISDSVRSQTAGHP